MADDLVVRLRAALDAEAELVEYSIAAEIDGYRADGGLIVTREQLLEDNGDGDPSPYKQRLRMVAAHRKILDLFDGTVAVRDIAWNKFRAGEMPTKAESSHATHAERELAALRVVLEALAEGYGIEP